MNEQDVPRTREGSEIASFLGVRSLHQLDPTRLHTVRERVRVQLGNRAPDVHQNLYTVAVLSQSPEAMTLKTIGTDHNNAAQNRIGSKYDPQEIGWNGEQFAFQYILQAIDGTQRLTSIATVPLE